MRLELLDSKVIEWLAKSGWKAGRKIDVSETVETLEKEGYKSFPYAIEIIEELDQLHVKKVSSPKPNPNLYTGNIIFDASDGLGDFDRMEVFESIAGEHLFPLGWVYGQWLLYVGVSKRIYMGSYGRLYLLGENIEDFLTNIILLGTEPKFLGEL